MAPTVLIFDTKIAINDCGYQNQPVLENTRSKQTAKKHDVISVSTIYTLYIQTFGKKL